MDLRAGPACRRMGFEMAARAGTAIVHLTFYGRAAEADEAAAAWKFPIRRAAWEIAAERHDICKIKKTMALPLGSNDAKIPA
ncbi:hypothetical protein [Chromobacterium sp. IIBBL 290-4]|uniref:hypothetical protein n=1 Tax=Chromobacterium sp. IIBBL 290-4 TaxID=2953890 RepID=UPI0020B6CB0D|nr:hypothetical protein [Chromobacterium sp. IIBBL 290-4]UTH75827.1 hypothetical protein NKT35_06920 [Chromobacterium sp. IIBBL 290-4]